MEKEICQTCLSTDRRLTPVLNFKTLFQDIHIFEIQDVLGGVCWECKQVIEKFLRFRLQVCVAQSKLMTKVESPKCLSTLTHVQKTSYDYQWYYDVDPLSETNNKNQVTVKYELDIDKARENVDVKVNKDFQVHLDNLDIVSFDGDSNTSVDVKPYLEELMLVDYTGKAAKDDEKINNEMSKKIEIEKSKVGNLINSVKDEVTKRFAQKKSRVRTNKSIGYKSKVKEIDEELKKKFSKMVLSEEQMSRCREEKRNQPNFKKIPFKCDTCVLGFTKQGTFDFHMETKHSEHIGKYVCNVCETRFPNKKPLEKHCRHHCVIYKCKLCKYETVEFGAVVNHCRAKHSDDTVDEIHCQQCSVVAKTVEDLEEHVRTQHTLECHQCGEKFKGKNTLRTHKTRIHGMKREFICDFCHKTFMTKTRLESHMVSHNESVARKLSYCAACRIQYKNIYVYRNHLKNSANHSERAYNCPECDKKFASKVYWTKHYNFYHLHKSPYSCDICNKLFISDWRLRNHKQKHHGLDRPRDHTCNVCGKKFFTLSTLKAHCLTHSEERTYMCEDCGDTFKQRPALYTHSRLVHKGVKRRKR